MQHIRIISVKMVLKMLNLQFFRHVYVAVNGIFGISIFSYMHSYHQVLNHFFYFGNGKEQRSVKGDKQHTIDVWMKLSNTQESHQAFSKLLVAIFFHHMSVCLKRANAHNTPSKNNNKLILKPCVRNLNKDI